MDRHSLSRTGRERVCRIVRMPKHGRKALHGETRGEVGGMLGAPAGRMDGAGPVEGSACPDHMHICLRIAPKRSAGDVAGRPKGKGAIIPRGRHPGRGRIAGRDRTLRAGGRCVGAVGLNESAVGRYVRNQEDGSRIERATDAAHRRRDVAAAGPSRPCRCGIEPLWGVAKAPGYAGGCLLQDNDSCSDGTRNRSILLSGFWLDTV